MEKIKYTYITLSLHSLREFLCILLCTYELWLMWIYQPIPPNFFLSFKGYQEPQVSSGKSFYNHLIQSKQSQREYSWPLNTGLNRTAPLILDFFSIVSTAQAAVGWTRRCRGQTLNSKFQLGRISTPNAHAVQGSTAQLILPGLWTYTGFFWGGGVQAGVGTFLY